MSMTLASKKFKKNFTLGEKLTEMNIKLKKKHILSFCVNFKLTGKTDRKKMYNQFSLPLMSPR